MPTKNYIASSAGTFPRAFVVFEQWAWQRNFNPALVRPFFPPVPCIVGVPLTSTPPPGIVVLATPHMGWFDAKLLPEARPKATNIF